MVKQQKTKNGAVIIGKTSSYGRERKRIGGQDLFIRLGDRMQAGKVRKCHRASFQQFIICIRKL